MDFRFAYLTGALLLGIPWLIFFLFRKDLRKEILLLSVFTGILAITEIWFYGKYWQPIHLYKIFGLNFGIEDIILCFFYGGVGAVGFQFFFKKYEKWRKAELSQIRNYQIIISLLNGAIVCLLLEALTHYNLVITSGIGQLVVGLMLTFYRKELFWITIFNAIIFTLIIAGIQYINTLIYPGVIDQFWQNTYLSTSVEFIGIPIEEFFWHFSLAIAVGPAYEVYRGIFYHKES